MTVTIREAREWRALHREGATLTEIARCTRYSVPTVRKHLMAQGCDTSWSGRAARRAANACPHCGALQ